MNGRPYVKLIFLFSVITVFIVVAFGCSYYYFKDRKPLGVNMEVWADSTAHKTLILKSNHLYFVLSDVKFDLENEVLHAQAEQRAEFYDKYYPLLDSTLKKKRFDYDAQSEIVHMVVFSTDQHFSEGAISLPFQDVRHITYFERDPKAEKKAETGTIIAVSLVTSAVVGIILAAALNEPEPPPPPPTSSNCTCPQIYSVEAGKRQVEGKMLAGAIYRNLQRTDYLPLSSNESSERTIVIRNEQNDREYLDQAQLHVAIHNQNRQVMVDQEGRFHTIGSELRPVWAENEGKDVTHLLVQRDEMAFNFSAWNDPQSLQRIKLHFHHSGPLPSTAKLILRVRGSDWADFGYRQFSRYFGNAYQDWVKLQGNFPASYQKKWSRQQGFNLGVTVLAGERIIYETFLEIIGTGQYREVVVPLDLQEYVKNDELVVALESGFMLYDIDYAAIDFTPNARLQVFEQPLIAAKNHRGDDVLFSLQAADKDYYYQDGLDDEVLLNFHMPNIPSQYTSTAVLALTGYYEHKWTYDNPAEVATLMEFRSPERYREFNRSLFQSHLQRLGIGLLTSSPVEINLPL